MLVDSPCLRRGWLALALAAVLGFGCGRLGFENAGQDDGGVADRSDSGIGAGPDASDQADGGTEVDEPAESWSAPTDIIALNSESYEESPTLTADGLELVFASNRPGGLGLGDLYLSRRPTRDVAWGPPEHLSELSSTASESGAGISADGLTIWFASWRSGGSDIYTSTRSNRAAPWEPPAVVSELSSSFVERAPEGFAGELGIVVATNQPNSVGSYDIFVAERTDQASSWSSLTSLGINGAEEEAEPWMSEGGKRLYFSSNRVAGNFDFYIARRDSPDQRFGAPELISELSSARPDDGLALSGDERYVVLARDGDLLEASR